MADLTSRHSKNPILKPGDVQPSQPDLVVECLLNPGVFLFGGSIWMLVRVAERPKQVEGQISFPILESGKTKIVSFDLDDPKLDTSDPREPCYDDEVYLSTLSHLRLFKSSDGVHFEDPGLPNLVGEGDMESYGIEDCRVATMDDGEFLLTYSATSPNGVGVGLKKTRDWKHFENAGMIIPPANKDCAIFESKIFTDSIVSSHSFNTIESGHYLCFHRPSGVGLGGNYIWLASSPDLQHWGNHVCIAKTRAGMWDEKRIGAGAAPIRTDRGWLAIYHGANHANRYCLGALLLDLGDPTKVLARSHEPIMEPSEEYEQKGFFGNVVFTNGHIVDGDEITLYYGASDTVICMAKLSINEILETL